MFSRSHESLHLIFAKYDTIICKYGISLKSKIPDAGWSRKSPNLLLCLGYREGGKKKAFFFNKNKQASLTKVYIQSPKQCGIMCYGPMSPKLNTACDQKSIMLWGCFSSVGTGELLMNKGKGNNRINASAKTL